MDKSTIIVGDFNMLRLATNRTNRQKSKKNIEELNTINQQNLIKIYRALHSKTVEYTLFRCPQNIHKDNPYPEHRKKSQKIQIIEIIQKMISNYNVIKLETNNRKIARKSPNFQQPNDTS